jgi:hypothetical protein
MSMDGLPASGVRVGRPSFARQVRKLKAGDRVEVLWVDASGCQEEDGEAGSLGGLQLLRSIGFVSAVDGDSLVTVRDISLRDETHRDTETIAVVNIVRVEVLTGEPFAVAAKWMGRRWVRELLRG